MILFQEIIETIESLPIKDQDYLFELIHKRRVKDQQNDQSTQIQSVQSNLDLSEINFDFTAPPIWELAARLSAKIPDEEWMKLPKDLAENFDYYQKQRDNL